MDHIDKPANAIDHCKLNPGNCDQYAAIDRKRAIKRPALIAQISPDLLRRAIIGWIITKRINKVFKKAQHEASNINNKKPLRIRGWAQM